MPLPKKTQQIRNNLVCIFWTNVLQMKIKSKTFIEFYTVNYELRIFRLELFLVLPNTLFPKQSHYQISIRLPTILHCF